MENEAYERWKQQFVDESTGTENAYKPLLIEGGDATSLVNQTDLDFINSRKFSRDELLAMWRVSPGIIGSVENVNRSNLEAGFYIHAVINIVPRVRQFVKQMNASLVQIYDPTYELDYVNPVPEDVASKLQEIKAGNGSWLKIDEARAAYGMEPLPDGMGDHVVISAGSDGEGRHARSDPDERGLGIKVERDGFPACGEVNPASDHVLPTPAVKSLVAEAGNDPAVRGGPQPNWGADRLRRRTAINP
jgi:hypothetical protein